MEKRRVTAACSQNNHAEAFSRRISEEIVNFQNGIFLLRFYHSIHCGRINLEKLLFAFDFMLCYTFDFVRNCIEFVSCKNHSAAYF